MVFAKYVLGADVTTTIRGVVVNGNKGRRVQVWTAPFCDGEIHVVALRPGMSQEVFHFADLLLTRVGYPRLAGWGGAKFSR